MDIVKRSGPERNVRGGCDNVFGIRTVARDAGASVDLVTRLIGRHARADLLDRSGYVGSGISGGCG